MNLLTYTTMMEFRNNYLNGQEHAPLRILDVGSQDVNGSYRDIFNLPDWKYIGLDIVPGKNVDVVPTDPYNWNMFYDNSFDVVISGQAFEHIEFFWLTMKEMSRVLKPGGLLYLTAPSAGHEHKFPVDCWRFFSDGFVALAKWANLIIISVKTDQGDPKLNNESDIWKSTTLIARK